MPVLPPSLPLPLAARTWARACGSWSPIAGKRPRLGSSGVHTTERSGIDNAGPELAFKALLLLLQSSAPLQRQVEARVEATIPLCVAA